MAVLDKQDYINKAKDLLAQRDTYRPLVAGPTNKSKYKLLNILKTIMGEGGIGDCNYKDYTWQAC